MAWGHLDLLQNFEVHCSSLALPDQLNPASDPEMEVDTNVNKKPAIRPSESHLSEKLSSDSWSDHSNNLNDSNEKGFSQVKRRKSHQAWLFATYGPGFICLREEHEFRIVLQGVHKKLLIEKVKEDLTQNLPVQSVLQITNRAREPLDLVLVTSNTTAIDNATKRSFSNIKVLCSQTEIKMEQPHQKTYQDNVSIVNFAEIRPKTASSEHAAFNAWATTVLPCAHAIKTQTGRPPYSLQIIWP
ncbi:hypothetical protein EVAR_21944_1 [Eumeta japonica]|uniref:Uncharacterized protein n=1 Tax=Eumeta variegata TaxID=151549 RepID=A0A4C1VWR8_EUMVA|nr:hypothetical protein EVAR_21944_1 [Eumeta japonica]